MFLIERTHFCPSQRRSQKEPPPALASGSIGSTRISVAGNKQTCSSKSEYFAEWICFFAEGNTVQIYRSSFGSTHRLKLTCLSAYHQFLPGFFWRAIVRFTHVAEGETRGPQQGMDPPSGHPPVDVPGAPKAAQSYSALLVRYLVRYSSPTVRY